MYFSPRKCKSYALIFNKKLKFHYSIWLERKNQKLTLTRLIYRLRDTCCNVIAIDICLKSTVCFASDNEAVP